MTTRKNVFYGILALVSLLGLGITQSAKANLITNGDFETRDFTGWIVTPASTGSFFGVLRVPPPHGTFGAFFGATDVGFDSISQTFVTTPGAFYNLSFFYQVVEPASPPNNGFRVLFNGVVVFQNLNAITGFSSFSFDHLQATGTTTTVEFQGRNVLGVDYLDDVSVTGVPDAGSTLPMLSFASLGLVALRRKLRC